MGNTEEGGVILTLQQSPMRPLDVALPSVLQVIFDILSVTL